MLIEDLDEVFNPLSVASVASPMSRGKHVSALYVFSSTSLPLEITCVTDSVSIPEDILVPLCTSLSIAASLHNAMPHCGDSVTTSRLCKQQTHEASLKGGFGGAA